MKIELIRAGVAGAFLLPAFEFLYGPGRMVFLSMCLLGVLIAMDWMSGWSASRKDGSYASEYGIDGVIRTIIMAALPVMGNIIDQMFGLPAIFFGLMVAGLFYHTLKSFVANSVRAGWAERLPLWILEKMIDWVRSEIEAKVSRALKRVAERDGDA